MLAFGGEKRVSYYACCLEFHANGHPHYHMCIKLSGLSGQRWMTAKNKLEEFGAVVNFRDLPNHEDGKYRWAYRYVTKKDEHVYTSPGHPSLKAIACKSNQTRKATEAL